MSHAKEQHLKLLKEQGHSPVDLEPIDLDPSAVSIQDFRIFPHKILRIKYTTYDVRRREDVVHPDSDMCNVMIPNTDYKGDETIPPYRYGRVIGIYHAHVSYAGEISPGIRYLPSSRLEFVWVRWYTIKLPEEGMPLECVSLPSVTSPQATGFVDPRNILRAAHLIPRFHAGRPNTDERGLSHMGKDAYDWKEYYINRCVVTFLDSDPPVRP